jgi:3-hydroxybutyrate dehydrogenase
MSENDTISPATLEQDQILTLSDERFGPENVCIVTGAASGIGRAAAVALASNGLTVAATDVDEEGLAETASMGEDLGASGDIRPVAADLTDDDEVRGIVDEAADLGTIRFLANIAGMQHISPLEDFPMERYDLMHRVMLRAPLLLSKLCLPHMRDSDDGTGCVGNMCSVHGHYVTADKVAYNVSKFGIRGLTQSIAAEGDGKIRAFTVSTGYVKTPLVTNQIPDTARERGISEREVVEDVMLGQARVKEMMEPVEVANLFTLGFSKYGRHLDGGDLLWDGGMTLTYD